MISKINSSKINSISFSHKCNIRPESNIICLADYELPNYSVSKAHFDNNFAMERVKIDKLALLILKRSTLEKIHSGSVDDPQLKYLFKELSEPNVARKVITRIKTAAITAVAKIESSESYNEIQLNNLRKVIIFCEESNKILKEAEIYNNEEYPKMVAFKGSEAADAVIKVANTIRVIDDKLGVVGDLLPLAKYGEPVKHLLKGETAKGVIKGTIRGIDTALVPAKTSAAMAAAAKGAAIGSVAGPPGAVIGAIIGGAAAWLAWNKCRDVLADEIVEGYEKPTEGSEFWNNYNN